MKSLFPYFLIICSISISFSQGRIDGFYRGKSKGTVVLGLGFEEGSPHHAHTTTRNVDCEWWTMVMSFLLEVQSRPKMDARSMKS